MRKAVFSSLLCVILLTSFSREALAQNQIGKFIKDTAKEVALDPTTYAPFGTSWLGKQVDWNSSQVFFRNGYVEANPDFTVSRLPNDKPISHSDGNLKLIKISLPVLQLSLINNTAASIVERLLIRQYPNREKLVKIIGWAEKIAVNSYFAYTYSHRNFSQWQTNKIMARELGLK